MVTSPHVVHCNYVSQPARGSVKTKDLAMEVHNLGSTARIATVRKEEEEDVDVQALVASGVHIVPPRFIRPTAEELASFLPHTSFGLEPIPMIDLEGLHDFRRLFTMAAIASACRDWGCFQVVNHNIPQSLLDGTLNVAREFFGLTLKERQAYKIDKGKPYASGYGRLPSETQDSVLDWGDLMFHYLLPLAHKNMDSWPDKPATYKETLDSYGEETRKVMEMLLDVLSQELRLMPSYFRNLLGEPELPVRVNYYPPCPQPELVMGLRAHSDPVCMTALFQDQIKGLQVKKGDKWVNVEPEPDALVIFVGDQIQIASNGKFKAATHRVVVNKDKPRISIATGLAPNPKAIVGPGRVFVNASHPARYSTSTYVDYRASLRHGVRW